MWLVVLLLGMCIATAPAGAQLALASPPEEAIATDDSLARLATLDAAVRANPEDASAWHRRGMLAWAIARAQRRRVDLGQDSTITLFDVADSSLRRAVDLDDDNPRYRIDLGRYRWSSTNALTRRRAPGMFERALRDARKQNDAASSAEALASLGVVAWRRYENIADRHIYSAMFRDPDSEGLIDDADAIRYFVENEERLKASKHWSGQREYEDARIRFAEAIAADPGNRRARAGQFMLLIDRQRWEELRHEAMLRLREAPCNGLAWLARGLATHRLGLAEEATVSFDSALACLPRHERARIDALDRVLSPRDGEEHERMADDERALTERLYWLMSDPLWLTPANEHRLEFLSRVTTAVLRWSVEEFDLYGPDTDRGDVLVRYGPPPAIISFPPDPEVSQELRVRLLWWYRDGVAFIFRMIPGYGVANLHPDYARYVRELRDTIPVTWASLGIEAAIDTIGVQHVRFRGAGDSSDVFIAAEIPERRLVQQLDLTQAALQIGLNIFTWRAEHVGRDSTRVLVETGSASPVQPRAWRKRLSPGIYLYRVEALQPDLVRGARATSRLEIVPGAGFGMSDLLVARLVEPRPNSSGMRWSDFRVQPMTGRMQQGERLSLLWETYELGAERGTNRYRVSITIEQRDRPGVLARLGAAIVDGVRAAVGRSSRGDGRVTLTYDRDLPASPVAVDYLTVDASGLSPGLYAVTVDVEDLVAKRRMQRTSNVMIVE